MNREEQLKRCWWQVRFYDERRHSKDISAYQRCLAEEYYHVYKKLYNDMCEQIEREGK